MKKNNCYLLVIIKFLTVFSLFINLNQMVLADGLGSKSTSEIEAKQENPIEETSLHTRSIFSYLNNSDWVVSSVLLILVVLSILCWGICIAKLLYLDKLRKSNSDFIRLFWKSKSLKELESSSSREPYSPAKEIFRTSYQSFERSNYLDQKNLQLETMIAVTMSHLGRSLQNAKRTERKKLETYLPLLAITASTAPFIGLLGTVWGIMNSFQSIALTGSASLSSVAPGLSEALIATAFGLGAAIPSAIGYSLANHRIRKLFSEIENFSGDFLSIVERYIVTHNSPKS